MIMFSVLIAVFLVGLLGGLHCASMCGGIIAALTPNQASYQKVMSIAVSHEGAFVAPPPSKNWLQILLFHVGRISTYTLFGAIAGGLASLPMLMNHLLPIQQILLSLASLMLIGLGLALGQWTQKIQKIELLGRFVWQRISPLTKKILPANTPRKAFLAGSVWGWLPCSMVYSVLMTALVQGSALKGALTMLVFGLGTLPNGVFLSFGSQFLKRTMQKLLLRRLAGGVVVVFGMLGLLRVLTLIVSPEKLLNHLPGWLVMCLPGISH